MSRKLDKDWEETPAGEEQEPEVQVYTPGSLQPKKKNRSVFGYLVILFVVAFLMLVLAFLMQERNNTAQVDALQYSLETMQSLDQLMEENRALRERNDTLAGAAEELESVRAELEQARLDLKIAEMELSWLQADPETQQRSYSELLYINTRKTVLLILERAMRLERYEEAAKVCRDVNGNPEIGWDPLHSEKLGWDDLRYYPDKRYVEIETELAELGYLTYEETGLTPPTTETD